jgi:membrane protein DedA with SNARE-associated domain
MCLINQEKVEKAESYFDEHGALSTFIGRLIPAVRQLISIPAGLAKMNIGMFVIFSGLGALTWNAILAFLGWWLAQTVTLDNLYVMVERYNGYLSIAGLALLVFCVIYLIKKGLQSNKQ